MHLSTVVSCLLIHLTIQQFVDIPNCEKYKIDTQNNIRYCKKCKDGYAPYTDRSVCRKCNDECKTCEGSITKCTSCYGGYRLLDNTCIKCPSSCRVCISDNICEECESGYYMSSIRGVCLACINGCSKCSDGVSCIECSWGYDIIDRDGTLVCQSNGAFLKAIGYITVGLLVICMVLVLIGVCVGDSKQSTSHSRDEDSNKRDECKEPSTEYPSPPSPDDLPTGGMNYPKEDEDRTKESAYKRTSNNKKSGRPSHLRKKSSSSSEMQPVVND